VLAAEVLAQPDERDDVARAARRVDDRVKWANGFWRDAYWSPAGTPGDRGSPSWVRSTALSAGQSQPRPIAWSSSATPPSSQTAWVSQSERVSGVAARSLSLARSFDRLK
jgi:hypothetical protein